MEQKMLQLLQNCKSIRELKQTHVVIFIHGLQESNFILPKLISLSSSFGFVEYATKIFESSNFPNVFVFNTMIECFIVRTRRNDALRTYNRMKAASIAPNNFSFTILLKSCKSSKDLEDGTELHTEIVKSGYGSNVFVQNTLLDFYTKSSTNLDLAYRVFEELPERDVVTWNSMIGAYLTHGDTESAIKLFDSMPHRNIVSWNSIISGLSKVGDMESAQLIFERMPIKNEVSWNAIITGYVRQGDLKTAQSIFDEMSEKTVVSWTAMISGYAKARDLTSANNLFNLMPIRSVISWNAMIAGYIDNDLFDQALSVFHNMLINGKCVPNETTLISILSACSHLGAHEQGKWIDSYVKKNKFDLSIPLGNALIDMFAKCGDVENAEAVFQRIPKKCVITWTSMVSGLAINGRCREALALFNTMHREGTQPDDVLFIAVLTACTHGGLVEQGKKVFDEMVYGYNIKPRIEHYGCMVDLLGRAGKLDEAVMLVMSMPLEPNAVIWGTLLSSSKTCGNEMVVDFVTRKILELEPLNPGYLTLISNLNASNQHWEGVLSVRTAMRQEGIEKVPGCSSIQIGDTVHEFMAKDRRHRHRKEIYEALYGLIEHLKMAFDVTSECTNGF
ncbi:pentatricopeptide repeat-containing protein At2g44880-like [Macadamia integrifolia]|uniref:pentatricopeptide repeat-containing protein At2g44880-like n=1 Tax=Macadamia integrifolia TaxID=60698 RepID=UPI001C4EBDF0|nr:pentatricopeptide repeat-containing protein At2g44880-like [Macadamia integrifolia]